MVTLYIIHWYYYTWDGCYKYTFFWKFARKLGPFLESFTRTYTLSSDCGRHLNKLLLLRSSPNLCFCFTLNLFSQLFHSHFRRSRPQYELLSLSNKEKMLKTQLHLEPFWRKQRWRHQKTLEGWKPESSHFERISYCR